MKRNDDETKGAKDGEETAKTGQAGMRYAIAGGASGAVTRALFQPLDVLKIRFQLQVDPIKIGSKYSSIRQATKTIVTEEGITALWSGHMPAQYLSISFGMAQFWCYEFLTSKVVDDSNMSKPLENFTCGAVAGSFGALVSFPFDTARTRMVADSKSNKTYTGVWHTFKLMRQTEGNLSLYKGLLPTIAQIAPYAGAQFMFYKIFNVALSKLMPNNETSSKYVIVHSLLAGSSAGFLAKLCVYPFDLAKKRLQIQGFQHKRISFGKQFYCSGFIDCIVQTIKNEGVFALYKGLAPSLIKATVVTSSYFLFYDLFCYVFKEYSQL